MILLAAIAIALALPGCCLACLELRARWRARTRRAPRARRSEIELRVHLRWR